MGTDTDNNARADPQADVIAFLSDAGNFPQAETVERIDTHAAMVFLAGPDAYKISRAVKYPFLDFSTLEKRRLACQHEIEVNRANAPQIYLAAVPLTRRSDGSLAIGGGGEVVEWAVHMARFDETRTLDRVIEEGPLPERLIDALARRMVEAHARAPVQRAAPWVADLRLYVDQNTAAFAQYPDLFAPGEASALTADSIAAFERIEPLLAARGRAGHVRLCHGDAHLGNIVLIGGEPVLFDAVEFNDVIATADVLYDLAFLLMDLCERGHSHEANRTLNRYLIESGCADHLDGLAALPFFLMMRAAIRAKVTAARRDFCAEAERPALAAQACSYFSAAGKFLEPQQPALVAAGGLSGSGKSTLAARIAGGIGRAPGAVVLRTDVMRKQIAGVGETEHLPPDAYSMTVSHAVYEALYRTAARILATGQSVIADAVFARRDERDAIAAVARAAGAPFAGLWLDAPPAVLTARVGERVGDASDADESVVRQQLHYDLGRMDWNRVDASGPPDEALAQANGHLDRILPR